MAYTAKRGDHYAMTLTIKASGTQQAMVDLQAFLSEWLRRHEASDIAAKWISDSRIETERQQ